MATIYCPECGGEVPENETICPACGFDLDKYEEKTEGDEFSELLDAANKRLSEENSAASPDNNAKETESSLPTGAKKVSAETLKQGSDSTPESADDSDDEETAPDTAEADKTKKKRKKGTPRALITFIAIIIAAALGFAAAMFMFTDAVNSAEDNFAIRSANAVNSTLRVNEKLYVYKAYVHCGAGADECILYYISDYNDEAKTSVCRVVVEKDSPDIINIYSSVDEDNSDFIAMKNSADAQTRVQASILKNYSDSIDAACREIRIGSPNWVKIDISKINSSITSEQVRASS